MKLNEDGIIKNEPQSLFEWERERIPKFIKKIKVFPAKNKQSISWYIGELLFSMEKETAIRFAKTILKELEE